MVGEGVFIPKAGCRAGAVRRGRCQLSFVSFFAVRGHLLFERTLLPKRFCVFHSDFFVFPVHFTALCLWQVVDVPLLQGKWLLHFFFLRAAVAVDLLVTLLQCVLRFRKVL